MSYGAFGQRRDPSDWSGPAANPAPDTTDRGYTGHQMLDGTGLIHMNGRVYDPGMGRFVSPDPNVPSPYASQSYNRYSYVRNNPLSRFDPSGFVDKQKTYCEENPENCVDVEELSEEEQKKAKWCAKHGLKCEAVETDEGYKVGLPLSEVQKIINREKSKQSNQSENGSIEILNPEQKISETGEENVLVLDKSTGKWMYVDRDNVGDVYHAQQAGTTFGEYACQTGGCKREKGAKALTVVSVVATGGLVGTVTLAGSGSIVAVRLSQVAFTADLGAYLLQPNKTSKDHMLFWGTAGLGYGARYIDEELELIYLSGDSGYRTYQIQYEGDDP